MKKYNLEILTAVMFAFVTAVAIWMQPLTLIQKLMLGYMFLYTLHEWEENRFPGGFSKLMAKFFGLELTEDRENASSIPVAVLLLFITIIPFYAQHPVLALVPVFLGLMEMIVHVVGIWLHKLDRPYTPGMVTALCLGAESVLAIVLFSRGGIVRGKEYLLGLVTMFICFALMQRTIIAIFGLSYRELAAKMRSKLKKDAT